MQTKFISWLLTGGSVAIPKRILAYMEPMGLGLEDLGALIYLLSLDDGKVRVQDNLGKEAAERLVVRHLITYNVETGVFDLTPFFERMTNDTGATVSAEMEKVPQQSAVDALTTIVARFEKEQGIFLPQIAQKEISEALLRYGWDAELVFNFYAYFQKNQRNHYSFPALSRLAYNAGVKDMDSLRNFVKGLDYEVTKVREVLRLLGKRNNPSEPQMAMYRKWTQEWGFSHEMIILGVNATTGADNPTMNYLDKILESWRTSNINTPKDINAHQQRWNDNQTQQVAPRQRKSRVNERYVSKEGFRDFSNREE